MDSLDFMKELAHQLKPYKDVFQSTSRLPEYGLSRAEVLGMVQALREREQARWQNGYASGAVYHGDQEYIDFLNQVYALQSQSNPLHADLWPSALKFEAEVVAMTADMLGGRSVPENAGPNAKICGTVSSGGTESILLAMKTYRDWARDRKGVTTPEIIAPVSAHAAFDKAAQYFGMRLVRIPLDREYKADVDAVRAAITPNTVVIVGSAPSFPHGIIDPIPALAALAQEHGIGCHVDACLGGFVLPWAEKLGYPVPPFDFRVPGVTSMSADTHKYGYAPKGSSVVLYRGHDLRHYQYYTTADWPGGLYFSPTFAGSRPGALSAAAWAALVSMGEKGYLEATRRILETATAIKAGIREIPELCILGDPLWVIAFTSDTLNIYQVMDRMTERGWSLNALQRPPAVHLAITLRHTQPGVAERFLGDLKASVEDVKAHPEVQTGMAPVYGLAASVPAALVQEILRTYIDMMYEV